jgi:hypothetical protein
MSFPPAPVPIRSSLLALAGSLLLISACSRDQPEAELQDLPPPPAPAPSEPGAAAAAVGGFTPLPTTNQVLAANPIGRSDPFASDRPVPPPRPPAATATAGGGGATAPAQPPRPVPLQLPPDFLFSGVIRVGASPQAMVQYPCGPNGPCNSGSVGVGEQGGRNTDLLPPGWVVSSIDVNRGRLVLRQGRQTVTAEL